MLRLLKHHHVRRVSASSMMLVVSVLLFACTKPKDLFDSQSKVFVFPGLESATVQTDGAVLLAWKEVPTKDTVKYAIYRRTKDETFNYASAYDLSSLETYRVPAYPLNQSFCFAVRYQIVGIEPDTNTNEICPNLATIEGFEGIGAATSTETGIATISWTAVESADVDGYHIYKGLSFENRVGTVNGSTTSFVVDALTPDERFEFGVRVVDKYGREDSNTRTIAVTIANNSSPDFNGLISATQKSATSVSLEWLAADGKPVSYKIFQATGASGCLPTVTYTTPVTSVSAPGTKTTLENLGDGQTHCFAVRAASSGGQTDSNTVSKCVTLPDNGAPVFSGIKNVEFVNGKARLTWDAAVGETTSYKIFYAEGTALDFSAATVVTVSGSLATYDIAGLADNRSWTFAVRAVDSLNQSDSNTVKLTKNAGDLTPPVFLGYVSSTALSETQVQVVFQRSTESDVSLYTLKYRVSGSGSDYIDGATVSQPSAGNVTGTISNLSAGATYEILVKVTDTSGNISTNTATLTKKTLDTTPPAFGGVVNVAKKSGDPSLAVASWTAATDASGVQEYRVYYSKTSLSGVSLNKNQTFPRALGANQVYMSAAVNSGTTLEVPSLDALSTYYFVVHAIDTEGNEDTNTVQYGYVVPDFTPPSAPTGLSITPDTSSARSNRYPVVSGTGETGKTVRIYVDGTLQASTDINSGTSFSLTLNLPNTSAMYVITAKQKNSEDIESAAANVGSYVLDVSAPTITMVQNPTPSAIAGAGAPVTETTFIFKSDKSGSYTIKEGSTTLSSGSVVANVNKSMTLSSSALSNGDGTKTLTISVTDIVNNSTSQDVTVSVDTTPPPNVTSFQLIRDDASGNYKISWIAAGLAATDVLKLWKVTGTVTPPSSLGTGAIVGSPLSYNISSATLSIGSESSAAFRIFPCDAVGNCNTAVCSACAAGVETLTFANQSEADILQFKWTDTATASTVRGGYSKDIMALYLWDGITNAISGGGVVSEGDANCSSGTTCSMQFSSDSPWTRRYFRVSSTYTGGGGNGIWVSKIRYWAKVPSGMVFVAKEEWPEDEYGKIREVASDFAIDKYEVYATTSVSNPGSNAGSAAYPNAYNSVFKSASGTTPVIGLDWMRRKQGCENRSKEAEVSGFVKSSITYYAGDTTSPRRKVHLTTGPEWFVAAYGTPDLGGNGNCHVDNRNSNAVFPTGSAATQNCVSYFNVNDMIGNAMEATDEYVTSISGTSPYTGTHTTYYGSGFALSEVLDFFYYGAVAGMDYKRAIPNHVSASPPAMFNGDDFRNPRSSEVNGAGLRGGALNATAGLPGRYAAWYYYASATHPFLNYVGARCALTAPAPRIVTFRNDSDGKDARFYWKVDNFDQETITLSAVEVYLAFGSEKSEIDIWDGTPNATLTNGGILKFTTDGSGNQSLSSVSGSGMFGLTCSAYTPAIAGSSYTGKCSIDLTAAPISLSPWGKRWFKMFARNASYTTSASHGAVTSTYGVGRVPTGMVFVAKEDWPKENQLQTNYDGVTGPFDYAIDKYEAYETTTAGINPGGNSGSAAYPNAYNSVLKSAYNQTPKASMDWYRFKQGCMNRTNETSYADFVVTTGGTTPRRKVHLATDNEWFVASFGTDDKAGATNCNTDNRGVLNTGTSATANCISRYGAYDMIGNLWEVTDSYFPSITGSNPYGGTRTTFYGEGATFLIEQSITGVYGLASAGYGITGWDYTTQMPTTTSGSTVGIYPFSLDAFILYLNAGGLVLTRGGWTVNDVQGGRFSIRIFENRDTAGSYFGARCALDSP